MTIIIMQLALAFGAGVVVTLLSVWIYEFLLYLRAYGQVGGPPSER